VRPINYTIALLPGLALSVVVALAAQALQAFEATLFGHIWLESLVLAILVGTVVRSVWPLPAGVQQGVKFSAKLPLEIAIVLLGASITAALSRPPEACSLRASQASSCWPWRQAI